MRRRRRKTEAEERRKVIEKRITDEPKETKSSACEQRVEVDSGLLKK